MRMTIQRVWVIFDRDYESVGDQKHDVKVSTTFVGYTKNVDRMHEIVLDEPYSCDERCDKYLVFDDHQETPGVLWLVYSTCDDEDSYGKLYNAVEPECVYGSKSAAEEYVNARKDSNLSIIELKEL